MKLICGLGNPGREYANTRHNIGFCFVDSYAKKHGFELNKKNRLAEYGEPVLFNTKLIVIKPVTFMNLSGQAVAHYMNMFKLPPEDIIVIHDEMDVQPFDVKIKKGGGAAGHNGIASVIECTGTQDFIRVRLGIGRPDVGDKTAYVLGRMNEDALKNYSQAFASVNDFLDMYIEKGYDRAISAFKPPVL